MPFGLPHVMSERTHQPASCIAIMKRWGTRHRSFALITLLTVEIGLSRYVRSSPPAALVASADLPFGAVAQQSP